LQEENLIGVINLYYVGIDIGSASICIAVLNEQRELIRQKYLILKGASTENRQLLHDEINKMLPKNSEYKMAVSGSAYEMLKLPSINEISALAAAARFLDPAAKSVMEIGGGSSKYIVDLQKEHIRFALNDNCSAGTGSFFAAQMQRLGMPLEDYSTMVEKAKSIPQIAGRCSVFAKTDIIHSQQAGIGIEDILLGLCYAVARNYKASVAGKLELQKPVLLAGGTVLNKGLVNAIKDVFRLEKHDLIVLEESPIATAIGAALLAKDMGEELHFSQIKGIFEDAEETSDERNSLPPLQEPFTDLEGLQATQLFVPGENYYLGIDIGSTSTNLVLLNEDEEVVYFHYLRTMGNPRKAVQQGVEEISRKFGHDIKIKAVATTGSGRHYIGRLIGADTVQDEITAQAIAAIRYMPEVDTVMEIGGQDSKYISIEDGLVRNFEMNKICAAGTGAFIEEQAAKLGISIDVFGKTALASKSPADLGDRCTVLIESSINAHIADGVSREDIAAGLCYSIVSNYLDRVVGDKPVGENILLFGGVAYNPGIIAAFKQRFGNRIRVGRYFNVNGAVGTALLAKSSIGEAQTKFKGLSCLNGDLEAKLDAETEARDITVETADTTETKIVKNKKSKKHKFERSNYIDPNKKTIGVPQSLNNLSLYPALKAFFNQLGYNVILSDGSSKETIERAQSYAQTEVCYPLKLAIGHTVQLLETGIDYLLFPSVTTVIKHESQSGINCACVYMHSAPSMLEKAVNLQEHRVTLLAPVFDLAAGNEKVLSSIYETGLQLGHSKEECSRALEFAAQNMREERIRKKGEHGDGHGKDKYGHHKAHKERKEQKGNRADKIDKDFSLLIKDLENSDKPLFVIITRGYCAKDPVLSQNIKEMIEKRGYQVLVPKHLDKIPKSDDLEQLPDLYWSFAVETLSSVRTVAATPNIYAVYLTYHGCGPDTMIAHWVQDEMKGKPYLHIEVDEHSSNVGIITRLDAFVNSVLAHITRYGSKSDLSDVSEKAMKGFYEEIGKLEKKSPVVLPYMYPYSKLIASYLRGRDFDVLELPASSTESLKKGRSYMRGKEHFSLSALLGSVALEAEKWDELQLLYPQNNGAEADGLYPYFIYSKLADKLSVVSPNLDELHSDEGIADIVFRILLSGDIALNSGNDALLLEMKEAFRVGIPDDETIIHWAGCCKDPGEFLLVLGEPACILDSLFHKTILQRIRDDSISLRFTPLSEMILFEWSKKDGLSRFKSMKDLLTKVDKAMGKASVFSEFEELMKMRNKDYHICLGGYAHYRHNKANFSHSQLCGVLSVASQHENTESVLELAHRQSNNPMLRILFDGTDDPINRLKIDTFLHEIKKAAIMT
jgi:predicted CoA-substrate-specific enzyme activase